MKILIFGGTTEGRELALMLSQNGVDVTLSVATEYGRDIINDLKGITVHTGRLSTEEMTMFIDKNRFTLVVDATHPYAGIATENIKCACKTSNATYMRLLRCESEKEQSVKYMDTANDAAKFLQTVNGNIFLTVGSKDLESFTVITDYKSRVFVRILPMLESLKKALSLGYKNSNIICMQGPFETDINAAMLKMTNAKYMVTKDSGNTGGFFEKLTAAKQTGCNVIVVERPTEESGYSLTEIFKNIMSMSQIPK